jgi:hypothetical protein
MAKSKFAVELLAGALLLTSVIAAEPTSAEKKAADGNANIGLAFERLKKLAGEWQYVNPKDEASKGQTVLRYKIIGAGSAVVETIFPDTAHEMVSVYHRDGEQLVMTHYCCCGNQPHMRAKTGTDKDDLIFEFAGGCNLNPAKDTHMHEFRVHFVDSNHLQSEVQLFADGKISDKHTFDLVRKK